MAKKVQKGKKIKKEKKVFKEGRVYVTATFNNTIVTITDKGGNTLFWGSAGASGFKGARKSTPYAATSTVENTAKKAVNLGLSEVEVFIKGPGPGRDGAIRALRSAGLAITLLADVTPIPHNGTRPRKRRRV